MIGFSVLAQNGFPYGKFRIKNFSSTEYSGNAQNWDIIQNNDNFIYFANNGGIIEFNGESWTSFEMDNKEVPRSFDKSDSGRIYVGGRDEFGYIGYDERGKTIYTKISQQVDSIDFADVWQVYCTGEHTYFVSQSHIFIHFQDNIEVINVPDGERIKTSVAFGELLICTFERNEGNSSFVLRGSKFFPINNSEKVNPIIVYQEGLTMQVIDESGHFHEFQQNGNNYQFVLSTERSLQTEEGFLINDIAIKNGLIVAGYSGNGVSIFNSNGKLFRSFKEKDGLENLAIRKIYFDQYDNIWLCNDNGITFIETSSAITSFDKDFGITGITEDIYLKNNRVILATHTDLFEDVFTNNFAF